MDLSTHLDHPVFQDLPERRGQVDARRTVGYTYHQNGSLATRTWKRMPGNFSSTSAGGGLVTSFIYDNYARLLTIDYPAASITVAATPDVRFTYDGAGRISTRTEAGGATTGHYLYKLWGAAWKETVSPHYGEVVFSVVECTYDTLNRPDLLKLDIGGPGQGGPAQGSREAANGSTEQRRQKVFQRGICRRAAKSDEPDLPK